MVGHTELEYLSETLLAKATSCNPVWDLLVAKL